MITAEGRKRIEEMFAVEMKRLEPKFISVEEAERLAREYFQEYLHDIYIDILLKGWVERNRFEHTEGYYLLILAQRVPRFLFNYRDKTELYEIEYATDTNEHMRERIERFFRELTTDELKELTEEVKKKLSN